jgi:hypothetical protein
MSDLGRKLLNTAKSYLGVRREPGTCPPAIAEFLAAVGMPPNETLAWCKAFFTFVCQQCGVAIDTHPNARALLSDPDWQRVEPADVQAGDAAVFWRGDPKGWEGHIAFVAEPPGSAGVPAGFLRVLGGNQASSVCYENFPVNRVLAYLRPKEQADA